MPSSKVRPSPLPALNRDISSEIQKIKENGTTVTVKYIQHDTDVVLLLDENFNTLGTVTPKNQPQPVPKP